MLEGGCFEGGLRAGGAHGCRQAAEPPTALTPLIPFSLHVRTCATHLSQVFNCDDLLLNFVAANLTRARSASAAGAAAATAAAHHGRALAESVPEQEAGEEEEESDAAANEQQQQQREEPDDGAAEEEEEEEEGEEDVEERVVQEDAKQQRRQRARQQRLDGQHQAQALQQQQQRWRQQLRQRQQAGMPSAADVAPDLPIQLLRPSRRLDLSRLSGVGECCWWLGVPCCMLGSLLAAWCCPRPPNQL